METPLFKKEKPSEMTVRAVGSPRVVSAQQTSRDAAVVLAATVPCVPSSRVLPSVSCVHGAVAHTVALSPLVLLLGLEVVLLEGWQEGGDPQTWWAGSAPAALLGRG